MNEHEAPDALSVDATSYAFVRARTLALAAPLSPEDCQLQSMPDASPTKWHLAHTTWFFETFVLALARPSLAPVDPRYGFLFNSYYEAVGPRHARPARGLLSRPSLEEVVGYRAEVDRRMGDVLAGPLDPEVARRLEIGLHHEQQHQELILTDALHALAQNPLRPTYRARDSRPRATAPASRFVDGPEGLVTIGHDPAKDGFAFDNEGPRHRVFLERHALNERLCTNGEMRAFVDAGGYRDPRLWLSAGFDFVQREGIAAPLYWEQKDGAWHSFSLRGLHPIDDDAPVCHVSFFEADALARFLGARLPTEFEWETFARGRAVTGNFVESGALEPIAGGTSIYGDVWEWTQSAYAPYPGYAPEAGALGEYNGKFMASQQVLRGGSCFSPRSHLRPTYRNFFPPTARWQMSGVRLAR